MCIRDSPNQSQGWELVSINKLGSWFLLMIISYVMVSVVSRPQEIGVADTPRPAGPDNASPIS